MTRRRKKGRKQIRRRLIFAVCAVTLAIIAATETKANTGQQEAQERAIIERLTWMFKVRDCRHICLFCEYFDICRAEGAGKEEKSNEHEICNEE